MARLPSRSKGLVLIAVMLLSLGNAAGQQGVKNGQWRVWGADAGSTRYSPLDQINRQNVKNLKVAWVWRSDNFGTALEFGTGENFSDSELMIVRRFLS